MSRNGASLGAALVLLASAIAAGPGAWGVGRARDGQAQAVATFGKITVGNSKDTFLANRKRVNCYALAGEGSITQLSVYLTAGGVTGQQLIEGVLYGQSAGAPAALLGTSSPLTFSNTNAAGWYPLTFTTPLKLVAGNYCIGVLTGASSGVAGFRYDSVTNSREINANTYSSGPSDPFGAFSTDSEQMSIYATYNAGAPPPPPPRPVNVQPPVISGTAQSGSTLSTTEGAWTESPSSYAYEWQRCNTAGAECAAIAGATGKTYAAVGADVGSTLRVAVTASNSGGPSAPASSAQTAVVSPPTGGAPTRPEGLHATFVGPAQINLSWSPSSDEEGIAGYAIRRDGVVIANTGSSATTYSDNGRTPASEYSYTVEAYDAAGDRSSQSSPARVSTSSAAGVQHYEYVFPAHAIDVYDMGNTMKLVKTISLPQATDMRGAVASAVTGMLYVSYGGDGGGSGGGSMLAYDLVKEAVAWTRAYPEGIDSMSISPDGKTIYMPVGESSSASTWNVLDASNGNITARIEGGQAPHNTIVSLNGEHVYMGGRRAANLTVADTSTNRVTKSIGPLRSGTVRPFTINGAETLAFTTATGFLGFQVSSITSGQALYTAPITGGFPYTPGQPGPSSPSHGISLSPDEKELWVIDQPNSYVHVFDVSGLPASPPKQVADIKLRSMTGSQSGCTYDCLREGWLQHSRDGRFVFVGDSGDVIDTATRRSVANLETLYNSRVFLEIDWRNGLPVDSTSRSGLGYVVP